MILHATPSRVLCALALVAMFGPVAATAQTQITIGATKDNTLYESPTGALSNGAGQHFFAGRSSQITGSIRRGLIAFDVAGSVPTGATISSVILTLNMSQTSSGNQTVSLHRALADWGEGTSVATGNEGGGAPSTTGDATWIHRFFDTTPWANIGGDYASTPSASQTVSVLGTYTWGSTTEMVADVQQWLDTPAGNFGWITVGNEDTASTSKRFDSKDNGVPTVRPSLTVTFTLTSAGEEPTPHTFSLSQNYPNPFNPSTRIVYRVQSQEFVELVVFDLLGRKVATLVNDVKQPGTYEVLWNADGVASGTYFYRMRAGAFVETRKLTLIR